MTTPTANPAPAHVQSSAFGCITIPFLLIALIPLGWGARNQWAQGELARNGESATGRVTELRYVDTNSSARRGRGSPMSAVVAFTNSAGEARSMIGSVNRYPVPWAVGDEVEVVYDPANPERADLRSEVSRWLLWFCIWCAVALVPFAIAILPIMLKLREGRTRA
jgi:uncharacterized protein DUF3592